MKHKKTNDYFAAFLTLIDYSVESCNVLKTCVMSYDKQALHEIREQMHRIEHLADQQKNAMIQRLIKEFLPPIDREDLITIYRSIDDITDALEEVVLKLNVYQLNELKPSCLAFIDKIEQGIASTRSLLGEFADFKHSKNLGIYADEIAHIEEDCDGLYEQSLQGLYQDEHDVKSIMIWQHLFEQLEICADSCRKVMRDVQMAYLKNI